MQPSDLVLSALPKRYSAKKMTKPVNFICRAPNAKSVVLAGDFNSWSLESHPMLRQPDGAWAIQVSLHHGHHRYHFVVDGQPALDPKAQGVANDGARKVSLIAVS